MTEETQAVEPADAPAPETAQSAESSPAAPEPRETPENITDGIQRRFDELTRYRREAERDRDHWRELAMNQRHAPPQNGAEKPKSLADFDFDDGKYRDYLIEQAGKRAEEAAEKRWKERAEQEAAEKRQSKFRNREVEFAKNTKDYFEKTRDPGATFFTPELAELLSESEEGPAVAYYLANNISEAVQLSQLSPRGMALAIGRLESKLLAEREKAKAAAKVSAAPPPPPKIEGKDPAVEKDPKDMSDAEFSKWRKRQIAQRR